jgi:heptosyltransferase-2
MDDFVSEILSRADGPPITVVQPGALGDTVLTLPALEMAWVAGPFAEVTLVGSAWAERLQPLVRTPLKTARFDSATLTPMFGPDPADPQGLFTGAERVIIYGADEDDRFVRNVRRLCGGHLDWWPSAPPRGVHAAAHLAQPLLGETPEQPPAPKLLPPVDALQGPGPGAVLAVHPGSGGRRKCWPAEQFARLARRVGQSVLLVEGPADAEPCAAFRKALGDAVAIHEARGLSLPEVAWALLLCDAFVGNDSGVSHFAAALGVPTVAVFGPTDPAMWGPVGRPSVCAGGRGAWPELDEVADVVEQFLAEA